MELNIEENGLVTSVHELGDTRMATIDLLARDASALARDSRAILGITGSPGAGSLA